MKKCIILFLLTQLMLSCGKANLDSANHSKTPIVFSSTVQVMGKATDSSFEDLDAIGVYISKWNGATSTPLAESGNYADNVRYTYASSGELTASKIQYYPDDMSKIDIYAYYPHAEVSSATKINFAVEADQSSTNNFSASDFMTSVTPSVSLTSSKVDLLFKHQLSKVIITLDSETFPSGDATITIKNVYRNFTYNLSNGGLTTTGSKSDIVMSPNGGRSFKAIVPTQMITSGEVFASIMINNKEYTWKPPYAITLTQSIEHAFTLSFDKQGSAISYSSSIAPWNGVSFSGISADLLSRINSHMPIYGGTTPPQFNSTKTYKLDQLKLTKSTSSLAAEQLSEVVFRLSASDAVNNTIKCERKFNFQTSSNAECEITGSDNNFTIAQVINGNTSGITTKIRLVLSGTFTAYGITNYYEAQIMESKGSDPLGLLPAVGTYSIYKEEDGTASSSVW